METSLDRFGRIVIPKKIREDFNLKAGTPIRIEENEQAIILTPVREEPNLHVKDGVLVFNVPVHKTEEELNISREQIYAKYTDGPVTENS